MSQGTVVTVRRSEIPKYLHSSELYLSFSEDGGDEVTVPSDCIKPNQVTRSAGDMQHLLQTMRFWISTSLPDTLLEFLTREYNEEMAEVIKILREYDGIFPGMADLVKELYWTKEDHMCNVVARYGRVDFLRFLIARGNVVEITALKAAAANGQTHCVDFLRKYLTSPSLPNPLNGFVWSAVVSGGHLECLKYLAHNSSVSNCCHLICTAMGFNQYACLSFLLTVCCPENLWMMVEVAVKVKNDRALECFVEHGCIIDDSVWKSALKHSPTCLRYLIVKFPGRLQNVNGVLRAIARCSNETMELLHQHRYPFSIALVAEAAKADNMECLQFLHQHKGYDYLQPSTMAAAASAGKLNLIKVLHEQGCPWDESAPTAALRANYSECLRFFLDLRGVPETAEFHSIQPRHLCRAVIFAYRLNEQLVLLQDERHGTN